MKKTICTVIGLQNHGVSLKDAAKIMGKKFACGAAVGEDEKHGECITIQGDIQERFQDFIEGDLAKYKIPYKVVVFEEKKKKKKKDGVAAADDGEDDE